MNRFRTVGLKLTLALAGLVAGALAIVYVAVVPSLQDRLIDGRLNQLERASSFVVADIETQRDDFELTPDAVLQAESQLRGVRLIAYEYLNENPVYLRSYGDSRGIGQAPSPDSVAQAAAEHQVLERGVVDRGGTQFAEVAVPFGQYVVLASAPLTETLETVSLVERRMLIAGVIALIVAALAGFALARLFARRIRRLERAAGRIAAGSFEEPVVDRGADELGELAGAFDDMRKRLAALERARREFIANASHELRTPIFALGGHLELLTDEEVDDGTRREFLEEMRLQVERLTKLATDLLDLSRLDAGRLRVEVAPVDLGEIAGSLLGEFSGVGRGSDHILVTDGEEAVFALGDEERVRQIGRILLENALVHTPAGTEVHVTAGTAAGVVVLRVEDNGPGIPPEDQAHVFERFHRSAGALAAGSGLGLAIARELAGVMGGSVELESQPGRTVFTLKLPAAQVTTGEREPALAR